MTFSAGRVKRNVDQADAGAWLLDGLARIADAAAEAQVRIALAPEPGHIVGTLDDFTLVRDATKQMTEAPLLLSLDAGLTTVTGERTPTQAIKEFGTVLGAVSLSDRLGQENTHRPLGEGDMNLPAILGALDDADYEGLVTVKLPRDSHRADELIPQSLDWLMDNLPN